MQFNINDTIKADVAYSGTVIASAATFTGTNIIDTANVREYVLLIQFGSAYTVGALSALNVQVFAGDKSDMSDEAQVGSNINVFSVIAANAACAIRVQAENYKRFQRVKFVTTGAPTAVTVTIWAITAGTEFRGTSASPGTNIAGTTYTAGTNIPLMGTV